MRNGNFFSFEDLVEGDAPVAEVDEAEMIETQAEATDATAELEGSVAEAEAGSEELETVDDVQEIIDDSIESGEGLDEVTVESLRVTLRGVMRRLKGPTEYVDKRFSAENFSNVSTRLANTKVLSQENEGIGTRIIEGIKKAFTIMVDLLASWASKIVNFQAVLGRAVDGLDRRIKSLGSTAKVKDDWKKKISARQAFSATLDPKSFDFGASKTLLSGISGSVSDIADTIKNCIDESKKLSEFLGKDNTVNASEISIADTPDNLEDLIKESGTKAFMFMGGRAVAYQYSPLIEVTKSGEGGQSGKFSGLANVAIGPKVAETNKGFAKVNFSDLPDVELTDKDVPSLSDLSTYVADLKKLVGANKETNKNVGDLRTAINGLVRSVSKAGTGEAKDDELANLKKNRSAVASVLRKMAGNATTLVSGTAELTNGSIRTGMWYVNTWLQAYGAAAPAKEEPKKEEKKD